VRGFGVWSQSSSARHPLLTLPLTGEGLDGPILGSLARIARKEKGPRARIGARPCLETSPEAYFAALVAIELLAAALALAAAPAAVDAALVAAEAALLAEFDAAMAEFAMSFIAELMALTSAAATLFAGVDLEQAASPRAETAIMVRAIFFTDFFLRMVASGCEENPYSAGRGAE
jgi:hypothetical protein